MDTLEVLDTQNGNFVDNKREEEKMAKKFKMASPPRKLLADITNVQQPTKPKNQDTKPQQTISLAKEYVDKLHRENMSMMMLLQERNKVIESHGIELQKLRINLQKLQQQNLQLAQANSQILAELNSGKDRLRALQHELGCKNGLLKARKLVVKAKTKKETCATSGNQVEANKIDEADEANGEDKKPCNTNGRRQSKNQALGSSTDTSVQAKENKRPCLRRQSARFKCEEAEPTAERLCSRRHSARFKSEEAEPLKERRCLRRQSARFKCEEPETTDDRLSLGRQSARLKSEEPKPSEDLLEIDEAKFPVSSLHHEVAHESGPTSSDLSISKEHTLKVEALETRRRSSGRPSRHAVEKVQSYKELPINVKMRRTA